MLRPSKSSCDSLSCSFQNSIQFFLPHGLFPILPTLAGGKNGEEALLFLRLLLYIR